MKTKVKINAATNTQTSLRGTVGIFLGNESEREISLTTTYSKKYTCVNDLVQTSDHDEKGKLASSTTKVHITSLNSHSAEI